ncbi:MAG: nitrilase-related carbon-nitrogen hydrolase [Caulobacteraceae bacterium]
MIVWSEAGLPAALDDYLAPGTWTLAQIEAALRPGQTLITGGYRVQAAPAGAYAPDGLIYHNSLIALSRSAAGLTITGLYDKYRLVPFGEYLPLDRELAPLGIKQLSTSARASRRGRRRVRSLHLGFRRCNRSSATRACSPASPTRPRRAPASARPGSSNVSDDAWFGVTSGPWQHLNLASYRAIEEGLPMVRATPTGISAVIDAFGRTMPGKRLGQGAYGVIDAALPPQLPVTMFAVCGGTLFAAMVLLSLASTAPFWLSLSRNRQR